MKIYMIRHAAVKMPWPRTCTSAEFDELSAGYDRAPIIADGIRESDIKCDRIYISPLPRTRATAERLFPGREYKEIEAQEVPLGSYRDTDKKLPTAKWFSMGRIQWFWNLSRQKETRRQTVQRCERVINELLSENEDCVIITHGFFLITFAARLKKHGFTVNGDAKALSNLDVLTAENK